MSHACAVCADLNEPICSLIWVIPWNNKPEEVWDGKEWFLYIYLETLEQILGKGSFDEKPPTFKGSLICLHYLSFGRFDFRMLWLKLHFQFQLFYSLFGAVTSNNLHRPLFEWCCTRARRHCGESWNLSMIIAWVNATTETGWLYCYYVFLSSRPFLSFRKNKRLVQINDTVFLFLRWEN